MICGGSFPGVWMSSSPANRLRIDGFPDSAQGRGRCFAATVRTRLVGLPRIWALLLACVAGCWLTAFTGLASGSDARSTRVAVLALSRLEIGVNGEVSSTVADALPAGAVVTGADLSLDYSTYWSSANSAIAGNYVRLNGVDVPAFGWASSGNYPGSTALIRDYRGSLASYRVAGNNQWTFGSSWNPVTLNNVVVSIRYVMGNQAPILSAPGVFFTDTVAPDTFQTASGNLIGSDADGDLLIYGIVGRTASNGTVTQAGTYVTLTVNSQTGAFSVTPNAAAINALNANTSETFVVSVSDGVVTTTQDWVIQLSGISESPSLAFVSPTIGNGGEVTQVGNFTIHTFRQSGSFVPSTSGTVEVLVVGGGGGGGSGGGGAGGVVYQSAFPVTASQPVAVTVGAGGAGGR